MHGADSRNVSSPGEENERARRQRVPGWRLIVPSWRATLRWLASLTLVAGSISANAAVTDCEGMAVDGQAQCIAPTYAPTQYTVCDIAGPTSQRSAAWNACSTELGITNPILSEAATVAYANCFDRKLVPTGGVSGPVPWLGVGTAYNDNLCTSGTVRDLDGHHLWGVGNLTGSSSNFAFTRVETSSCPANYTIVSLVVRGITEQVRCKPTNPPCPPGEVVSPTSPPACRKVAPIPATAKVTEICDKCGPVGNPIVPLTGAKTQPVSTGFRLSGSDLVLVYDTTPKLNGFPVRSLPSFGQLWSSSLHKTLGIGSGATVITAYRGIGSVVTFVLKAGAYTSDADVNDRIAAVAGGYLYTDAKNRRLETYSASGRLLMVEAVDGSYTSFTYSSAATSTVPAAGYLVQATDQTGRFLKFEYVLPAGASEAFSATAGLVSRVVDSSGQAFSASYDANLNLSGLTWQDSKSLQFLYEDTTNPWAMTGRLDENLNRNATWTYDGQGRAVSTSLAAGVDSYSVSYATPPQYVLTETEDATFNLLYRRYEVAALGAVTVTTPNGQSTGWQSATLFGAPAMTGLSQPAGSGTAASSRAIAYDASGNVASRDDFLGVRTCYAYDSGNRELTRVEGLSTSASCAGVLPLGATLPTGARKITTQWHPEWRLPTKITSPGRTVTTVYHGQTDPFASLVANCTTAALMSSGNPLPVVCKVVDQSIADSASRTTAYTYGDVGNLLTVTDARGNADTVQYQAVAEGPVDPAFDRVKILLHGDGTNGSNVFVDSSSPAKTVTVGYGTPTNSSTSKKFGAASLYFSGASSIKVAGVGGTTFWASDWTVEFAALPGTPTISSAGVFGNRDNSVGPMGGGQLYLNYASGLLTYIGLEVGVSSQWAQMGIGSSTPGFDAARSSSGTFNQIAVTKQGLSYTFFLNGVKVGSATQSVTAMTASSADLYVGAANHNAFYPFYFNGYIDDFRITMDVARYVKNYALRTTAFPDVGQSPGVDPALYNVQSTTNAAGHTVQFTQYDVLGRVLQSVDPKGIVTGITYTARGWVQTVAVTAPGGSARTTTYSYNDVGQLMGVANPDGSSVAYTYDASHRLTRATDARGNSVTYTLDSTGNRIAEEIKDPGGTLQRAISRSFDALNRLQQVTGAAR